jgi:uncharacterized protein (DUF362 family)
MSKSFINIIKGEQKADYIELIELYNNQKLLNIYINNLFDGYVNFTNKRILLKPNWVLQPTISHHKYSLVTNENLILAVIGHILSNYKPESISIGDAPIQDCNWDQLFSFEFQSALDRLSKQHNLPISIKDYRRTRWQHSNNKVFYNCRPVDDFVIYDLGSSSMLEPITGDDTEFRVNNYNPAIMKEAHGKGFHKYCIIKDFFSNDVVITIPKIKTHCKTGITGAMKILVGLNGDKDFLPHHRKGSSKSKGDCYRDNNIFIKAAETLSDQANKNRDNLLYQFYNIPGVILRQFTFNKKNNNLWGAWYGNDTAWRMVFDLNRIALYGDISGKIHERPQREIFNLSDAIVAGQGNGPLRPEPLPLGTLSFSNNSILTDLVFSILFGFDYKKIPLIAESLEYFNPAESKIRLNDRNICLEDLWPHSVKAKPAPGWRNHIEFK